jgi:hypothetical protein
MGRYHSRNGLEESLAVLVETSLPHRVARSAEFLDRWRSRKPACGEAHDQREQVCGRIDRAARTRVLLTEAAEGGWGIGRIAFGRQEFAALLR